MAYRNTSENSGAFAIIAFYAALIVAAGIGYVMNIIKIVGAISEPISAMFVLRCVGAFAMPIGAILGWF